MSHELTVYLSSNIDEVLLINPSANAFIFGDFNIHHKDWLTYSSRTDRPGELLCSTMAFSPLGNSDHVVVSVSIDFLSNSKWDVPFHRIAYDYSRADWNSLCNHLRDVTWEDIFKLSVSAAASEYVQVGIDVYISQ